MQKPQKKLKTEPAISLKKKEQQMFLKQTKFFINACARLAGRYRETLLALFFCLTAAAVLQSVNTQSCYTPGQFPEHGVYSGVLTPGRDCEVPALRYRLNEQLQINARTARTGNRSNLMRSSDPVADCTRSELFQNKFTLQVAVLPAVNQRSSYQVHSTFTDPVRAGPACSCD